MHVLLARLWAHGLCAGSRVIAAAVLLLPGASAVFGQGSPKLNVLPGMPPVLDSNNIYSAAGAGMLSPVVAKFRDGFWDEIISNPPSVIVLSNECFNRAPTFDKLKTWPKFNDYLAAHYQPVIERQIRADDRAYRIYVRKDDSMSRVQEAR